MELVYLLGSILSASITSLLLSLLIPVRLLLRRFFPRRSAAVDGEEEEHVSLYEGTVWHERRRPVHHSFRYSVRYAFVDLDRCTRPPPDHLSADQCRSIAQTRGSVFLLTVPPSVGYEQNPLSVYYCYEVQGGSATNLKICIAEVTNTPWGERVLFLFNPDSDVVAKPLHVSPFMDMLGNWTMKANAPGENMFITISVQHPELGDYFTAALTAKRISSSTVDDHALFFWLMPHKVAIWIYWHALKLWWKGVPFIQHPRYTNKGYRQQASVRDGKIQTCPASFAGGGIKSSSSNAGGVDDDDTEEEENGKKKKKNRCFTWRDAKWPWSS